MMSTIFIGRRVFYTSLSQVKFLSSVGGRGRNLNRGGLSRVKDKVEVAPKPKILDPWIQVKDDSSGQLYWWNQETNETTHLGAPKPTVNALGTPPPPQQQGSLIGELGGMVVQGMAFGTGSAIARSAVNAIFDSGSDDSDDIVDI